MNTADVTQIHQEEEDSKKLKAIKITYPISQLGGGIEKSYFSIYAPYFYTNVYMMSAAFSGIIAIVQTIIGWIGSPLFGIVVDKVNFKNSKYYPWMIMGPILLYGCWIMLFALPTLGITNPMIALLIACILALSGPLVSIPGSASYPLLSSDPKDRQYFAMTQKVFRDGGKTLFGYIFPALLAIFALTVGESGAYAICGIIAGGIAIIGFIIYGLTIKGSYVERKAMASSKSATGAKKSIPISLMFKTIFTNRPLLAMFLMMAFHKGYYFIYTSAATYMFRYVWNDFSKMATFMFVFNLTAIIGVMFGPLWRKIFKETKRCFVAALSMHILLLIVMAVFFKSFTAITFTFVFGASSFFMGMLENYVLPLFAAASDYGAWKSGSRVDGISMSIYALSIITGTFLATIIRTWTLVAANLDAVIKTKVVTPDFISKMSTLFSWIPLGLGIIALLSLVFIFNLNDEKIARINADLRAGKTAATSDLKI
jgi:Na+/melibiose symporter and related transporters